MEIVTRNDVPAQEGHAHLFKMAEHHYRLAMVQCGVPAHLHEGLVFYLVYRRMTGSFLRAVLDNNLRLALARGDAESIAGLRELGQFLVNYAPMHAWGSEEAVDEWLAKRV